MKDIIKSFQDLVALGYSGADADLAVSLFEYDLVWRLDGDIYRFVYGTSEKKHGFGQGHIRKDTNFLESFDWVNWDTISKYVGLPKTDLLKEEIPYIISTLLNYYGCYNVFGVSPGNFTLFLSNDRKWKEPKEFTALARSREHKGLFQSALKGLKGTTIPWTASNIQSHSGPERPARLKPNGHLLISQVLSAVTRTKNEAEEAKLKKEIRFLKGREIYFAYRLAGFKATITEATSKTRSVLGHRDSGNYVVALDATITMEIEKL